VAGGGPNRWGFHRLTDQWARRLVSAAGIHRGDLVLDVGAGWGAITAPLVRSGARVVAVELHDRRAHDLRLRFAGAGVKVVQADASDLRLPRRPFRIVANPPFGVSTALLRRALAPGSHLVTADIVLPLHVARRWLSPKAPGAPRWHRSFDASIVARLPAHAFRPAAPMDIVVFRVRRR